MPNNKNALLYFQQILSQFFFRNSYPKIEINTINKNNNNLNLQNFEQNFINKNSIWSKILFKIYIYHYWKIQVTSEKRKKKIMNNTRLQDGFSNS